MPELSKCRDCKALTGNLDDAREHRAWHTDYDKRIEAIRRIANDTTRALQELRVAVNDYRDDIHNQTIPEDITITDAPDDEDDDPNATYTDDPTYELAPDSGPITLTPPVATTPNNGVYFTNTP